VKATLSPGPPARYTLLLLLLLYIRMNPHTCLVTHVRVILHYILSRYVYSRISIRFHIYCIEFYRVLRMRVTQSRLQQSSLPKHAIIPVQKTRVLHSIVNEY